MSKILINYYLFDKIIKNHTYLLLVNIILFCLSKFHVCLKNENNIYPLAAEHLPLVLIYFTF